MVGRKEMGFVKKVLRKKGSQRETKFSEASEEVEGEWTVIDESDRKSPKDDFELLGTLGKGTFGQVMLVKEKHSGTAFAMKIIEKKSVLKENRVKDLFSERSVLRKARHPFIMHLHRTFQNESKIYFVMDYLRKGDFNHFLNTCPGSRLAEGLARKYAAEIFLALSHLHTNSIVYRDLKPENILLDNDGHICLSDFGLSKDFPDGSTLLKCNSFVGSPFYIAPDVLRQRQYGMEVDWWGFGILIYRMLTGVVPFTGKSVRRVFDSILHDEPDFTAHTHISREAKDLIKKLLEKKPSKRISGGRIRDHPWFADVQWEKVEGKEMDMEFTCDLLSPGPIPKELMESPVSGIPSPQQILFAGFTYPSCGSHSSSSYGCVVDGVIERNSPNSGADS